MFIIEWASLEKNTPSPLVKRIVSLFTSDVHHLHLHSVFLFFFWEMWLIFWDEMLIGCDVVRKSFMCHLWLPTPTPMPRQQQQQQPTHPFYRNKRTIKDCDRLIKMKRIEMDKSFFILLPMPPTLPLLPMPPTLPLLPTLPLRVASTDHHSCLITFVCCWSIQSLIVVEYRSRAMGCKSCWNFCWKSIPMRDWFPNWKIFFWSIVQASDTFF